MNINILLRRLGLRHYKHIFFDLDRTLWDFDTNAKLTLSNLYDELDLSSYFESFEQFSSIYYKHNERLWLEYRHGRIAKEALRKQRFELTLKSVKVKNDMLASQLDQRYISESPTKTALMPHTNELLTYLKDKGYRMWIITNGFNEVQGVKLRACGIENFFEGLFTSENVGYQKPNAKIFERALSDTKCKSSDALMIGDDFNVDIAGARNASIDQLYYNPRNIAGSFVPTYEIKDLIEAKKIL